MNPARMVKVLADLDVARRSGEPTGPALCRSCADVLGVSGAGIALMVDGQHRGSLGATNAAIATVEELQFTLGEGPCIDAWRTAQPVLEPDLAHPDIVRWPAFAGPAVEAGVAAVFGFPLHVGEVQLGALDIYLDAPGDLRGEQLADAAVMARVITDALLAMQSDAGPVDLAPELDAAASRRAVVHRAAGMISVQLGVTVDEALVVLRAHAYAEGKLVNDVARAVVARRLTLD